MLDWLKRLLGGALPETGNARERVDLRAPELPASHVRLIQGPPLGVVGESRYRGTIQGIVGKREAGHSTIVDAALVWEPDNRFDPNAIAIQVSGKTCGYLGRADAKRYQPVIAALQGTGKLPVVRGDIRGGFKRDDGTWAEFGITLYVAKPDRIAERL